MKKILFVVFTLSLNLTVNSQSLKEQLNKNPQLIADIEVKLDSSSYYYDKGYYAKSLQTNIKLLELAKKAEDPKYINQAYRFLAYDFLVINDTILARENFENAKKYAEVLNDDVALGLSFMDLANYYSRSNSDYNKVLDFHEKSISKFKKAKDTVSLVKAYYNATISAFAADNLKDGKRFLTNLSNERFNPYNLESYLNATHTFWAEYYNKTQQFKKAEIEAKIALDLVIESENIIDKTESYNQLSISFAGQKKFSDAYTNRLLYEENNIKSLAMLQTAQSEAAIAKFQVDLYQNEIEDEKEKTELQAEIAKNKNSLSNILIVVCVIGFFVFIALLFAFNRRRALNKALKEKNKEYLAAKEKSEHLAKAKSKFFSTVSHELRTPLYGVIGLSTILLEDPSLKSHEKDIKSLKFSADYLLALINDVLQINKIDSKKLDSGESSFHVKDFIQGVASTFEYMRLQNKNVIEVKVDPSIPEFLKGNVVRLSQILMNLVGNACKFTENGTITISLEQVETARFNDNAIKFTVADTGIGIAKEKQATIFDEFTQVATLDYSYQGTGLGLPIVQKLLKASNSEITIDSEIGEGTKFSFQLAFKTADKLTKPETAETLDANMLKGKNILVAEDNRINQIVTKKILEKKGVICTVAENGKEAIDLLKKSHFDLVLMDLNMPVMDGFEATIKIRKFNPNIPIVALTAVEVEEVRNEIYYAGMDDIIVKPYDDTKFTRIILKNLSNTRKVKSKKKQAS